MTEEQIKEAEKRALDGKSIRINNGSITDVRMIVEGI